jgi:hypothetical protein
MQEKYGPPQVLTRRGGHWYFRHPKNGKVSSRSLDDGLDRKGDGGYVIAPPSTDKRWTEDIPDRSTLPLLPREFRDKKAANTGEAWGTPRTMATALKEATAEAIARRVTEIPPGRRHEHLTHLCGVLLSRDVSGGDAEDILITAWTKAGGEFAERASREVPNTLRTRAQAIAERRATGVPKMEEFTPGLYEELENIFEWKVRVTFGGRNAQPTSNGTPSGYGA